MDQLNQILSLDEDKVDIKDAFSSNLQFEKLINFSAEFNLESGETEDIEASSLPNSALLVYQRCLQRLFLLIFKMYCLADFK